MGFLCAEHSDQSSDVRPLKILHISFHKGCIDDLRGVSKALSLHLTSWFIHEKPRGFLDGKTSGNAVYNIGYERAKDIWEKHREYFDTFDVIITSDTAPLSRVFLQNGWKKPLIIWICNHFDYYDGESLDCDFPDKEYYDMFREAAQSPHVFMVANNPFEHLYAKNKGIDTGDVTIPLCGAFFQPKRGFNFSTVLNKSEKFFLPSHYNETEFINLAQKCQELELPYHCGKDNGPLDLSGYKGIIHFPFSYTDYRFFENIVVGVPYFIPSKTFLKQLAHDGYYSQIPMDDDLFTRYSEWYSPAHESIITYFDSWEDLKEKIDTINFDALKAAIKTHAEENKQVMFGRWNEIFNQCRLLLQ